MRVALQGEIGSFHHLAAGHWFGDDVSYLCGQTFAAVFELLQNGQADQAVVAIENSLYGSISEVYDLLKRHHFPIIGELSERIHQNLIALPGVELSAIGMVLSHPVALAQCSVFLENELGSAEKIEYYDTAAAVNHLKQSADPTMAAIGSSLAAELAGLAVLRPTIEDDKQNYTRFLVIARDGAKPAGANKSSLVLQTSHQPGALYAALGVFASSKINLTKLQSRPIAGEVWQYQFYVDVEAANEVLADAISQLKAQACQVSELGQYVAHQKQYVD